MAAGIFSLCASQRLLRRLRTPRPDKALREVREKAHRWTARNEVRVRAEALSAQPPGVVARRLSDLPRWREWSPADEVFLERSLGRAIRRVRTGPVVVREEILERSPGGETYRLLSGLPLRGYTAQVSVTGRAGGSRVVWSATFHAPFLLAWAWRPLIRRNLELYAQGLAHGGRTAAPESPDTCTGALLGPGPATSSGAAG
jgi:hypothetical protein